MRPTRLAAMMAVTALATTAFAPAASQSSSAGYFFGWDRTVDGVTFEVGFDSDADQPTVLLIADADYADDNEALLTDGGLYTLALVDLGCGDVAGPQDVAAISEIASYLAGHRTDDDGNTHRGNGEVLLFGVGVGGLQALMTTAALDGTGLIDAVATEDGWTDPYDALFLGGVARRQDPIEVLPDNNLLGELVAESAPLFPCVTDGATDGTRDAWWAERSATDVVDAITVPTYTGHMLRSDVPIRQSHALITEMIAAFGTDDGVLRVTTQCSNDDAYDEEYRTETVRGFLRATISPDATSRARAERDLGRRGYGYTSSDDACLALCTSSSVSGRGGLVNRGVTVESMFLNRTFEQDLDCTPTCVPGPGTGEVGSLESTNRYESPWASQFTWVDAGADSERLTYNDRLNDGSGAEFGDEALPGGHGYHSLAFRTDAFEDETTIYGTVTLEGTFSTGSAGGTITPLLTVVNENGFAAVIARGAIDLDFASGLDERNHVGGWKTASITFDSVMAGLREGDRLEVILQSNNVGWFAPGTAQGTVNVATGPVNGITDAGTVLHVPFLDRYSFIYFPIIS